MQCQQCLRSIGKRGRGAKCAYHYRKEQGKPLFPRLDLKKKLKAIEREKQELWKLYNIARLYDYIDFDAYLAKEVPTTRFLHKLYAEADQIVSYVMELWTMRERSAYLSQEFSDPAIFTLSKQKHKIEVP